jgi:hypothetical protein
MIVATSQQNRVRRTFLGFLVAFSLSGFMDRQAFAHPSFPSFPEGKEWKPSPSPPPQPSTTEINDNDPSILYSRNNWSVSNDSADYNGDEHDSNLTTTASVFQVQGADVVVNFNGTGIQWIGRTGPNFGIASYSIDGFTPNTFDAYSSNDVAQTVNATINGLAAGSHSLKIEVTPNQNASSSGLYQTVDAFVIQGTALPPSQGSVAGYNSSAVKYTGPWTCGAEPDGTDLSGGHCYSNVANSSVSWTFTGSLVEVYGRPDLEDGIFNVLIDGTQVGQVDGHFGAVDNDALNAYCLFTWKGAAGTHTITLVVTGTMDAQARDAFLQFDEFVAFP